MKTYIVRKKHFQYGKNIRGLIWSRVFMGRREYGNQF